MARYAVDNPLGLSSLLTNAGVLIEGCEDATEWTSYGAQATGSAISDDTTNFHSGTQSVSFTSTAAGTVRYNHYEASGADLSEVDTFSMWFKWDKVNTSSNVTIYLSSDGNTVLTNRASLTLTAAATGSTRLDGGAICLTWKKADMTPSGSIDWSNVTNINMAFNMQAANEVCSIDSFYCGRRARPKLLMCVDDSVNSGDFPMVTNIGVANTAGIPVTNFVIPSLVDGAGYMTTAQLTTLQSSGNLIAGHTNTDFRTANSSVSDVLTEIQTVQTWLNQNGFNGADYWAWPGGQFFDDSPELSYLPAATQAGIKAARSITGVVQTNNNIEKMNLGLIEPLAINAVAITDTPANLLAAVDEAISHGTCIAFYSHKISSGSATPAGYEITGDDFSTLCDGIKQRMDKGLIDAVTFKDFYETYLNGHTRDEV